MSRDLTTAEWKPAGTDEHEYLYNQFTAKLYIDWIEGLCRQPEGFNPGKPLALLDWQKEFAHRVYGTVRWSEEHHCHLRQYNEVFIGIAKKNGKTGFIAAVVLAHCAIESKKERQDILIVAADVDQAKIMFDAAANMIRMSDKLSKAFTIRPGYNKIIHNKSGGTIRVKAPDAKRLFGGKFTLIIIDELVSQPNDDVYKTLRSSFVAKKEPLFICITTAGYKAQSPFCYEIWQQSKTVMEDPVKNTRKWVWIRETSQDADLADERVWAAANPGFGVTKSLESMRLLHREALLRPSEMDEFRAMQLNQWVDGGKSWIPGHVWLASGGPAGVFDEQLLHGRTCFAGLDLSKGIDFSSWVLLFPGSPTDHQADGWTVLVRSWVSDVSVEARKDHLKTQIKEWAGQGWLTVCEDEIKKKAHVLPQIEKDLADFDIKLIGVDPYMFDVLNEELEERGVDNIIKVTQTMAHVSEPTKDLEHYVVTKRLWHGFNPVLTWQMGNVVIQQGTEGGIKINKSKKKEAIDGVAALVNAFYVSTAKLEEEAIGGFIPWSDFA